MRTGKIMRTLKVIFLLALLVAPTAVSAGPDDNIDNAAGQIAAQHEREGASENAQDVASEGDAAGFVLGFLGGIIFLIIAVVAVVGAVGLGIIGIGYASVSSSEE